MKFFSKKKKKDDFLLEEDIPAFTIELQDEGTSQPRHSPNVLTPEEILGLNEEGGEVYEDRIENESALDSLRKKITVSAEDANEPTSDEEKLITQEETVPETQDSHEIKLEMFSSQPIDEMLVSLGKNTEEKIFSEEMDLTEVEKEPEAEVVVIDDTPVEVNIPSLLDKCQPYIIDENGEEAIDTEPLYKLQSVAEILKSNSERVLESLSEKYEISFDDLGHSIPDLPPEKPEPKPEPEKKAEENRVSERIKEKILATPEKEVFEDTLPVKNKVKNVQSNVASIISDIDTPEISLEKPKNKDISNTATITFTPVSDGTKSGSHITVSTQTRPIDLTGELVKLPSKAEETAEEKLKLEKNEFEEYVPEQEIRDEKDAAKFIRAFSVKRRKSFLQTAISVLLTLILAIAKLPFLSDFLLSHTVGGMIVCGSITAVIILVNYDMFLSLPKIIGKKASPDALAAIASLVTAVYAVFGIIAETIIVDMLILLSVILSVRALSCFFRNATLLSNLKIISQSGTKRAVKLIDDTAVTMAMAKNSIEGEALIAAPQRAEFFGDYMKYATFGTVLNGGVRLIAVLSLLLSVIIGFTCGVYFDGVVYGFYAAASIQCFASLPVLFLIDNLPLYRTAKKLNRKGAMICGKIGALHIENANAAVLNAVDIFPSGTVTLHQMQVLSDNNLEDTIIRAASLTESLGSPLTPIFKKIAGTGNITVFPDSDTVKYEDRMGISGWVDNRLLFIGNRTLMEAHGIEVPPLEVDRKILTQGYFPVYVATRDKACALLVIQYNVDMGIAGELRRLTNSGVTLLVNSSDPNLTEEMICDYMGIYPDSVKVMTAAGCHMYRNVVAPVPKVSVPAAFRSNPIALISIMNCASRIKRSNILLTIVYLVCAALGTLIFAYTSLGGSGTLISEITLLIYGLVTTAVSYFAYLIERP